MEPNQVVEWVFYGAITLIAGYLSSTITKLRESIELLNVNMASEIQKIASAKEILSRHELELEKLECRITIIERNQAANYCGIKFD